tara:strand:- start:4441 stop:5817 length:1377 start_codon:yes stop_codon:yes gene_type:complete
MGQLRNPNLETMKRELDEMGFNSETFCTAPYLNIDLDQDGAIYTCYRGKTNVGDWKKESLKDSFNGPQMQKIRKDLYEGRQNKNCRSCWAAEKKGSNSPRVHFYYDFMDQYYEDNPEGAQEYLDKIKADYIKGKIADIKRGELRPSSLCNLRCMHCGPHSSTKWVETLTKGDNAKVYMENEGLMENGNGIINHNIIDTGLTTYYKNTLTSDTDYEEDLLEVLDSLEHISFTGGEPLLTPEHPRYLQHFIDSGNAKNMYLEYNTNLNIKNIEKFFPLWENFKHLHIRASIDASFDTYEYFRTYGKIDLLKDCLQKIQKFRLEKMGGKRRMKINATVTHNLFSALRWKDLTRDWTTHGVAFHVSLIIDHPISVIYMPKELREKAVAEMQWCYDNIEQFTDDEDYIDIYRHHTEQCIKYTAEQNHESDKFPEQTIKYIEFCDKTSGKSYKDYFPELIKYLE